MFRDLLAAVRAEASGERARDSVAAVSRFHRVQSSPGYDAAAAWLEGELRAIGLVPERDEVPGDGRTRRLGILMPQGWECARARAVLEDGGDSQVLCDTDVHPLAVVLRSTPVRGRFTILDVGAGTEAAHYAGKDVAGTVVLASGPAHRVHRLAVVERGAAGLLTDTRRLALPVRTERDERDALNYTSFWWNETEPRGWGFVVTPDTGDRLRARLATGARLFLDAVIDARAFDTTIPLVTTRVGPAGAEREVLVTAHLCHPFTSANDNGSGVAAALETARVLATLAARGTWRPRHAVRFLWMPELTGTHAWLGRDPARATRTLAAVNLDMVGQNQDECGSTFLLEHAPCFSASFAADLLLRIRGEAPDWVTSFSGPGHYGMTRMAEVPYSGGSDHVTWIDPAIGVPCPMLIQWPDRFYHSSHDTVEHTDPASLALAVRCAATYAGFLAAAGDDERAWLTRLVARGARRRLLEALDGTASRAGERARLAGDRALASLARLGIDATTLAAERERFAAFAAAEGITAASPANDGPIPRRALGAPLDFQPHLYPGWERLPVAEREELRRLLAGLPGGTTAVDVAWAAADGVRPLAEIARLVSLELGVEIPVGGSAAGSAGLARLFAILEMLGLVSDARSDSRAAGVS